MKYIIIICFLVSPYFAFSRGATINSSDDSWFLMIPIVILLIMMWYPSIKKKTLQMIEAYKEKKAQHAIEEEIIDDEATDITTLYTANI